MLQRLREIFEIKSGYKDEQVQAKLLEKHFKFFDSDGSGIIDFDEFTRAMVKLNFVGVQAEVEALFDRFDEDLNGNISYSEFANAVFGMGNTKNAAAFVNEKAKNSIEKVAIALVLLM